MQEVEQSLAAALDAVTRKHGVGPAYSVFDAWLPTVVDQLVVHLGNNPVQRLRLRNLQLAVQRIRNVKAPRIRARHRKTL